MKRYVEYGTVEYTLLQTLGWITLKVEDYYDELLEKQMQMAVMVWPSKAEV
jgi:hypothetical protein